MVVGESVQFNAVGFQIALITVENEFNLLMNLTELLGHSRLSNDFASVQFTVFVFIYARPVVSWFTYS